MILTNLCLLLERATINKERLEIVTTDSEIFTGIPKGICDGDDDLACYFYDIGNRQYDGLYLKDIARVRRVGEVEYAYVAKQELVEAI
ncbi:MAG: hypothetical protein FWG63_08950 [Defluviitaleaceae bacterium]|nr:hypothetical protein [Defluviitaleaceae bacterium]